MPAIAWSLLNLTRRVHASGAAALSESSRKRAIATLLLWLEYLLALTFAPLALTPLLQSPNLARGTRRQHRCDQRALGPILLIVLFLVRYSSVLNVSDRGAEEAGDGMPIGDRTDDRNWKWGLIYYNPADPALWIERRFGIGYTFNFARPSAWWVLGGFLALPLLAAIVLVVFA